MATTRHLLTREDLNIVHPFENTLGLTTLTGATLAAILDDIGSDDVILFLTPGVWIISADLTIPENVALIIPRGASVSVNTGVTLTLNGQRLFEHDAWYSGLGTVNFTPRTLGLGAFSVTNGFTADPPTSRTRFMALMGSIGTPVSDEAPAFIVQKHSDVDSADGPQSNATLYVSHKFFGAGALRSAVSGLFVTEQRAPSVGAFVEGIRSAGVLVDTTAGNVNSAYGVIATAVATADVPDFEFLVGVESEAINVADADVPNLMSGQFFDNTKFSASFMASGLFGKRMTAGFLCNPFSDPAVAPYAGFFAPLGSLATTGVFAESTAETVYGLRLSRGTQSFACIAIPNNTPIRARESATTSERNILYVNTGETLVLGQESEGIILSQGDPVLGHYHKSNQSLVWSEIAAGQVANQAVTVTGVQLGDNVHATPEAPLSEFNVRTWVASTNSVAIQLHNWTAGALTPPTTDWAIDVWKHTI